MKKSLRIILVLAFFYIKGSSQTVFWYDNFDLPAGGAINNNAGAGWTLNSGGVGSNQWFINTATQIVCGSSNALHISCAGFPCTLFGGPNAPVYNASVTSNRTAVSPIISTLGRSNLILSFSWACFGEPGSDFGSISFSSNGGSSWDLWPLTFSGTSGCSTFSVNLPEEYENIENFRIRFGWQNDFSAGTDPAFFIDNIQLLGEEQACQPPTADAGQNAVFCAGGVGIGIGGFPTASNGSGNYSFSWSPATGLSSTTDSNPIANPSETTTYTVTVTDLSNNCVASDQITITALQPEELFTLPQSTATICAGSSIQALANAGFTNYVWTGPEGNLSGQSILIDEAGNYQVSATGSNGCLSVSDVLQISVINPASLEIIPSQNGPVCQGTELTLSATAGFSAHLWSGPSGTLSGPSIQINEPGIWQLSATDANGCDSQAEPFEITFVAAQDLAINLTGQQFICSGQVLSLSADEGFSNYMWQSPLGSINAQSIAASSAGSYSATATDVNGCTSASETVELDFYEPVQLFVQSNGGMGICPGGQLQLDATIGFTSYVWNTPFGILGGQSIVVTQAGNYAVSAVDMNGCNTFSDTYAVVDFPELIPEIDFANTDLCLGEVNLSGSTGFSDYVWITPSGALNGNAIEALEPGVYQLQAIDENGCETESAEISVSGGASVGLGLNPSGEVFICEGQTLVLQADSGFDNYAWNGSSGTSSIEVSEAGLWQVSAISPEGCTAISETVQISVYPRQTIGVNITGSTSVCPGDSVQLQALDGFENYTWSSEGVSIESQTIFISSDGFWQISAVDENGCLANSDSVEVELLQPEMLLVVPSGPLNLCPGLSVTLSASEGFSNYAWNPINQSGSTITTSESGSYYVSATSAEGCLVTSAMVEVNVFPEPPFIPVSPEGPITICSGEQITLSAGGNYSNFLWSNNATTPDIVVTAQGTYIVTANDSNGCAANSQSVFVDLIEPFTIGLTPAGEITLCEGEELELVADSGYFDYIWNDNTIGISNTIGSGGVFSVSARDENGCVGVSEELIVVEASFPDASFEYIQTEGYEVVFTNTSENADAWFWNFGGGNTSVEENPVFDFLFDNNWPVTLIVSNACGSDTLNTSVEVIKTVFPNIATEIDGIFVHYPHIYLSIESRNEPIAWRIFSVNGALLAKGELMHKGMEQLPQLSKGLYVLEIRQGTNVSAIRFPVIEP